MQKLDAGLEAVHVPYSYGFAIMLLTLIVKLVTFPLTAKQVQSTVGIQAIQPRIKELQAKYPNDQERLQMETARLYKESGVNPLAGCLPTLATIPVFIGLYRYAPLTQCRERFPYLFSLAVWRVSTCSQFAIFMAALLHCFAPPLLRCSAFAELWTRPGVLDYGIAALRDMLQKQPMLYECSVCKCYQR